MGYPISESPVQSKAVDAPQNKHEQSGNSRLQAEAMDLLTNYQDILKLNQSFGPNHRPTDSDIARLLAHNPLEDNQHESTSPKDQQEFHAMLHQVRQILTHPDHANQRVEYNTWVGSSWLGVGVSGVHRSILDNDKTSNDACHAGIYELMGRVPDVLIHSHPEIFQGNHERPWWYCSPQDTQNLQSLSKDFGNEMTGYVLGPDGSVLRWRNGDKTIHDNQGDWGVPTLVGKFNKDGDFVPYKYVNGKPVPVPQETVKGSVIDRWSNDNKWGT